MPLQSSLRAVHEGYRIGLLKLEGSRLVSRHRGGFEDGFFHLMVAGTRRTLARGYLKTYPRSAINTATPTSLSSPVAWWIGLACDGVRDERAKNVLIKFLE
jgi:hypothetical protein